MTSPTASATAPITATLPHSTGSRRGTTVNELRIIPLLYSPAAIVTPRTPIAGWEIAMPFRLV